MDKKHVWVAMVHVVANDSAFVVLLGTSPISDRCSSARLQRRAGKESSFTDPSVIAAVSALHVGL